jgi:NADH-quinone oxidoreductase subunit M
MGFVNVWDELDVWMMSAIIAVPAVFAIGLVFFSDRRAEVIRWWALLGTLATFVLTCLLFVDFLRLTDEQITNPDRHAQLLPARSNHVLANWYLHRPVTSFDLVGRKPWIGRFHIDFFVGVDGLNMALLLLASSSFVLACIASWKMACNVRGFYLLVLLLEACVMGLFLSLDFFLFFAFFAATLLPTYLLLAHWGMGKKPYAALKYFLFALVSVVLVLVAMLALYFVDLRPYYLELSSRAEAVEDKDPNSAEVYRRAAFRGLAGPRLEGNKFEGPVNTFDLIMLAEAAQASAGLESRLALLDVMLQDRSEDPTLKRQRERAEYELVQWQTMSPEFQLFCFLFLLIGFGILLPVVPFHLWVADAHEEAATPVSMILASVMPSIGGYGLLRIALPLCPIAAQQLAWVVAMLGVIGMVYGVLVALAQSELKRLLAYLAISQVGFVLLGLAVWASPDAAQYWSWGMKGATFHLVALGLLSAGLYYLAGLLQERLGHLDITRMGGLMTAIPVHATLMLILLFGMMGLPFLSGFIGPFCVLLGTWNFRPEAWTAAGQVFAMIAAGTLIVLGGCIVWTVQRMFARTPAVSPLFDDLDGREGFVAGALVVVTVGLGVWPMLVFEWLEPTVTGLVQILAKVTAH